jgi:hypothetical protein
MKSLALRRIGMLSLISVLLCVTTSGQTAAPPYRFTTIRVVSYDQETNTFSEPLANNSNFLNALNLSFFVVVEVSGKAGSYSPERRVGVTVTAGNRQVIKRVTDVGILNEQTGKYYVPIWIYGSFCENVLIKARLLGQRQASPL